MQLSVEQKEKLLKKLSELKISNCNICGSKELIVSDVIFEIREFKEGGVVIGGSSKIMPLIAINCKNCGNTLFFNAINLGIIEIK